MMSYEMLREKMIAYIANIEYSFSALICAVGMALLTKTTFIHE